MYASHFKTEFERSMFIRGVHLLLLHALHKLIAIVPSPGNFLRYAFFDVLTGY